VTSRRLQVAKSDSQFMSKTFDSNGSGDELVFKIAKRWLQKRKIITKMHTFQLKFHYCSLSYMPETEGLWLTVIYGFEPSPGPDGCVSPLDAVNIARWIAYAFRLFRFLFVIVFF
jgi:hypothetical protein